MLYGRDARSGFGGGLRSWLGLAGAVLLVSAALDFAPPPAAAAPGDVFSVEKVAVDITADTASVARTVALAEGEKRAFRILMERLTMRVDHDRLPRLEARDISGFVQDFSVDNEKTSAVRYIADLNYRFVASRVRRLLRDHAIPFAETLSKPVLVLPIYRAAATVSLWDDPNPWRQAWLDHPPALGLVPLVLPLGDLADIASIGPEQALRGDAAGLERISRRYDTKDVLVPVAALSAGRGGLPVVEVSVTRYGGVQQDQTLIAGFSGEPGETMDAILGRAAVEVAARVEDQWKADNLIQFGRPSVLAATLPIATLADWVEVRNRLGRVAVIDRTELVLMSRDEVRLNLHFLGDVQQLSLALSQIDLTLSDENGAWVLRRDDNAAEIRGERAR
jgi:hypothetical protein